MTSVHNEIAKNYVPNDLVSDVTCFPSNLSFLRF
jgi:hypothetical protein